MTFAPFTASCAAIKITGDLWNKGAHDIAAIGYCADRSRDRHEIDTIAWQFLCSVYTGRDYWDWPLERRIDAFLRHLQRDDLLKDGAAYNALVERVMANIARARRDGVLDQPALTGRWTTPPTLRSSTRVPPT